MSFTELIEEIGKETKLPKAQISKTLSAAFRIISSTVKSGEPVGIKAFGKFKKKVMPPRKVFGKENKGSVLITLKPYYRELLK